MNRTPQGVHAVFDTPEMMCILVLTRKVLIGTCVLHQLAVGIAVAGALNLRSL